MATHPQIADSAVLGIPDDEWGEQVKAVIELRAGVASSPELIAEIVAYCRTRLAAHKCPRTIVFVDALPRDPSGKLRKRDLR
jgi:acyl-coenzyme A synthetase/AMP-(fatty) acid ligase